ncbi:MAG: hypothetical protein GX354_07485 [Firmicutes bacterium]|jgi:hypothetical protein|nr:hypothetical protein [Bacillota bacterium]
MNIPKTLWAIVCRFVFTDGCRDLFASDLMFNVYLLVAVILLGQAWRRWAWFRKLTELYTEYYHWVEKNVPLAGNLKLRRYMEKLNEAIVELRGAPMTDREIQRAKLYADALAQKDHMSKFYGK